MRTPTWRFAVGHGRHQPRSSAQRQHPSRSPHERLEPSGFAAESRPHTCRILKAIRWQPRRVTNRPSDDPGPCRRCAAAHSIAADAPTHISLGSHARSGLRMRRSPRTAVPCGHRNGASLSATDASNPTAWQRGSAHPDHRMRGRMRLLTAGDHRNANGWGPLRRGTRANATHASVHRGQTGPCTRAAQRLSAALSIRSSRACSDRTPSMGCASVGHRDLGSPINKRERNVRRTLLATPMRLVRNGNELRPYGR